MDTSQLKAIGIEEAEAELLMKVRKATKGKHTSNFQEIYTLCAESGLFSKEELSRLFDKIVVFDKNEITKEEKDLYNLNDMMYNELYENGGLAFHLKFMYPQTITNRWM